MLLSFDLAGGACYGAEPVTLSNLQPVNYIFGPNGSGKTTISRAFAGHEALTLSPSWDASGSLDIRVYNRDFIENVLTNSHRIPGVFVIGEQSVEAENRLEEILKTGGEREQAKKAHESAVSSVEGVAKNKLQQMDSLTEVAWKKYKDFIQEHEELVPAFTGKGGIGNSRSKLVEDLLTYDEYGKTESVPKIDELVSDAIAIYDDDAISYPELALIEQFDDSVHEGYKLLTKEVRGSSETRLSDLVNELGNTDWVAAGRGFLENSEGLCPFCQQKEPEYLAQELTLLFDDVYSKRKQQLESFVGVFEDWATAFDLTIKDFNEGSIKNINQIRYRDALQSLRSAISENRNRLELKLRTPSTSTQFIDLNLLISELNETLEDANKLISTHNELIERRMDEHPNLTARCRRYLAQVELRNDISQYKKKMKGISKGETATQEKLEGARERLLELDREVRKLQQSVKSTKPVIDRINGLLKRSGFTSFEILESAELENGYMLSRDGTALAEDSLSEGERTFIAFLYFLHLLDSREDSEEAGRLLAVIDDPISSLDSDVLFIVSTLIRNLISRVLEGNDHIAQIIILTHNVYFHKEVSHARHGEKTNGRAYWVIRKVPGRPNVIDPYSWNPISTEYERLWSEVRQAHKGEEINLLGLENILRRILESYFRMTGGGIWEQEILSVLSAEERPIFQSLFSWINQGSHAVFEDLYYSRTTHSQNTYLDVFRSIFVKMNHEAHYQMMLLGKASVSEIPAVRADAATD